MQTVFSLMPVLALITSEEQEPGVQQGFGGDGGFFTFVSSFLITKGLSLEVLKHSLVFLQGSERGHGGILTLSAAGEAPLTGLSGAAVLGG